MRLTVNDPTAIPALVAALQAGECLAEPASGGIVEVLFPWLEKRADAQQAIVELAFFARTWEALHPGLEVRLAGES